MKADRICQPSQRPTQPRQDHIDPFGFLTVGRIDQRLRFPRTPTPPAVPVTATDSSLESRRAAPSATTCRKRREEKSRGGEGRGGPSRCLVQVVHCRWVSNPVDALRMTAAGRFPPDRFGAHS